MKAVIPVAGEGTRLRPHTYTRPKCLIEVGGKPILDHILESLVPVGVTEAVLIVGYKGERVAEHVERSAPQGLRCVCVEQPQPLGLGHAVLQADGRLDDEPIVIIYGDTLFETDLGAAVAMGVSVIGTAEVDHPDAYGVVFRGEDGRVTRLVEKPKGLDRGEVIVGVNVIRETQALLEFLRRRFAEGRTGAKGEYQITDAFQDMVEAGIEMSTFPVRDWYDCGNRKALLVSNRYLLDKSSESVTLQGCAVRPPVRVSPSATVRGSVIGPNVTIGDDAVVENAILRDTIVSHGATVSGIALCGSVIGAGARVEGRGHMLDVGDNATVVLGDAPMAESAIDA